jgi:hypothetical protein
MSKLVEPTETISRSTTSSLLCIIVGTYSWISTPAISRSPHVAFEASFTVSESMCSPGSRMRMRTPRWRAAISALLISSSGTK